jgi:hypothetical protein
MTDFTPILHLPEVAPNQDQKEATINTAIAILEAAMNDTLAVSVLSGSVSLTQDQFTRWFLFQAQGPYISPATRTITVPQTPRWFAVENQTDTSVFVTTGVGGALNVQIPPGKIALIVSDGADLRAVIPDPVNGVGLLQDLANVQGVPTDGQLLRWVAADGQWEPWTLSVNYGDLVGRPTIPRTLGELNDVEQSTGTPAQGAFLRWIDGVWQADFVDLSQFGTGGGGGSSTLAGLTDVYIPLPENGQQLIFDALTSKWIAGSIWNGTGSGSPYGTHLYWRVRVTANNGSSRIAIGELEFRADIGTSDQANGGTASADASFLGNVPANAFANDAGTSFWVGGGSTGWLAYQFPSPVAVQQIQITHRADGFTTDAPKDFVIEYSDDGSSWVGVWSVTNQTGWSASEVRAFTDPLAHTGPGSVGPTLDLMFDVDYPTGTPADGQVLTWNGLVNQWEPMATSGGGTSGPLRLGQLSDVDDGTGTPVQGAFLRWIDGVWQADPFQVPPYPTKLGHLSDVEDATGTPAQGAFLRWIDGAWQADPFLVPSIPRTLGELNDVDQGTGTPGQGAFLRWIDGVWQADPFQVPFIPRRLGQLADVEDATGTPNQGAFLRFIDGVWQADPFLVPSIPRTLGELNDVEQGTGTPVQGAYLRWIDGVWQADQIISQPFDVVVSRSGKLYNGQTLAVVPVSSQVTFEDDFAGSSFYCKANPAATTVLAVMRVVAGVATQIGSISISTAGVGTFTTTGSGVEAFNTGNVLRIDGPATADTTLSDFGFVLKGKRIL